jgi:ribosome-associated toxin RatA of RatAB toxin-antitoxin module
VPVVQKSALVSYSADQMFDLVNDVDRYQQFLPWCRDSKVLSSDGELVRAKVEIAHGALHKSFTTKNRIQQGKVIEMRLEDGPFKQLEGFWRFQTLSETACKVSLDLQYEFSSRLIGIAIGPVFSQIANSMVDAFTQRAHDVYGNSK